MVSMFHRLLFRLTLVVAACGLVMGLLAASGQDDNSYRGRKYKTPPPTARVEVTILRDFNGKPIENAAVVFHPMEGDKDRGAMELKTNEDGKTVIDVLPLGDVVRLQVIARGFQTYGEDYKIDKTDMAIEVKMKRPGEQYSTYKHAAAAAGQSSGANKKANPPTDANATPDASAPKQDDSSKQQDAQPSQPQPK
jgi:hypothetical protein